MNEITRIHLGRQPFVIAVDAHKQLREYLEAIKEAVGTSHKEVIEEVELRMAELLIERGITEERAILTEDVVFLKEQLGKPGDFKGDETEGEQSGSLEPDSNVQRRLFRDEKNGMAAGVCAGLAAYFHIDVVFVRLAFVLMTLIWGWGILLYIILWIVVPAARSSSDRLQMRGKAVTVDNLTQVVNREVSAAASRAGKAGQATGQLFTGFLKVAAWIIGAAFATTATAGLFALTAAVGYLFTHQDRLIDGVVSFPVGTKEAIFVASATAAAAIILLWFFLIGTAMMKRKWTLPGWVNAMLWGVFLAVVAVGSTVTLDTINSVRNRYEAAHKTVSLTGEQFDRIDIKGDLSLRYEQSDAYKTELTYLGEAKPDITAKVAGKVLTVDATKAGEAPCKDFCIDTGASPELVIHAPKVEKISIDGVTDVYGIEDGDRYRAYRDR